MREIVICNQALSPSNFYGQCGIDVDQISAVDCSNPSMIAANTPYLIGKELLAGDKSILSQLSHSSISQELANLSLSFGEDNVAALAEITDKLNNFNIGLTGAATSVYGGRMGAFGEAVKGYQMALMQYRDAVKSAPLQKVAAKQKVIAAFQKMQGQFQQELKAVNGKVKARRGIPLTNSTRAMNIAKSSRNVAKLNISTQVQASNLAKLGKQTKYLGSGLAVIDFGSRAGNIHNSYQSGGNWEREMFMESSSFAASALAGTAVVNAGTAALGFLMVATPVGWVGLVNGGLVVAGSAAGTSIWINGQFQENSGNWYDDIMSWMGM